MDDKPVTTDKGPQTIIQNDLKITKTNLYVKVDI